MSVQTITIENFEEIVHAATTPVLLDFWAPWCGPCRMLTPTVEELAEEQGDKLLVGKVNVDEQPDLASRFGIMSIPTLLVFQNGELRESTVGVKSKADILTMIGLA